jgi:hypothetical protein
MSGPLLCWGSRQAACRYLCELSTRVSDPAGAAWRRRGGSKGGREAWWLRYSGVRTGLYMYGMGACMLVCYMHVAPPWHILSVQYHECSSTPHAGSKCCTTGVTIMYLPPIGTRGGDGDDLCPYMLSPQTFLHALWSLVQFSLLAWPFRLRCVGAIGNEQLARYPHLQDSFLHALVRSQSPCMLPYQVRRGPRYLARACVRRLAGCLLAGTPNKTT